MCDFHDDEPQWVGARANDILFGRGDHANKHLGNKLFREAIKERKTEYILAGNDRLAKARIAQEIITSLRAQHDPPPRFLRKATVEDSTKFGVLNDAWCIVDEKSVLEKTKQALRQKASEWMESLLKPEKVACDASSASANLDSVALAALIAEQERTDSLRAEFEDDQVHQQEAKLPFVDEDHPSDNLYSVPLAALLAEPKETDSPVTDFKDKQVQQQEDKLPSSDHDHSPYISPQASIGTQPAKKGAIQSGEVTSRVNSFSSGYSTNDKRKYAIRPNSARPLRKIEYNTARHHRGKFKTAQESHVASITAKNKKSSIFLQKATASDALRLGIPVGARFETSVVRETKQCLHHEASALSSYNDTNTPSSSSTARRYERQVTESPEAVHPFQTMVQEDLSDDQDHHSDRPESPHQTLMFYPKQAHRHEVQEDMLMPLLPQIPPRVSFDYQDHHSNRPPVRYEVNATPKEEFQGMIHEHELPMQPSCFPHPAYLTSATVRPREGPKESEMSHSDCDTFDISVRTSLNPSDEQQITVPSSESQDDLLLVHLQVLRDAYLSSALTRPSGLQIGNYDNQDLSRRQAIVSEEATHHPCVRQDDSAEQGSFSVLQEGLLTHFRPDAQVDEEVSGENVPPQQVKEEESLGGSMVSDENDPILLSSMQAGESSLDDQELLATFLQQLPIFTDTCDADSDDASYNHDHNEVVRKPSKW